MCGRWNRSAPVLFIVLYFDLRRFFACGWVGWWMTWSGRAGWPAAHACGAPCRRDAAPVSHLAAASEIRLWVTMLAMTGRAPLRRRWCSVHSNSRMISWSRCVCDCDLRPNFNFERSQSNFALYYYLNAILFFYYYYYLKHICRIYQALLSLKPWFLI